MVLIMFEFLYIIITRNELCNRSLYFVPETPGSAIFWGLVKTAEITGKSL